MPRSELMELKEDFNFASEVNHDFFHVALQIMKFALTVFKPF